MPDSEAYGHFLVVDDNIINRKTLERVLTVQGHQVTTAENGRQALQLLRASHNPPFEVSLLDILMPEVDGYQVLEQVKNDPGLRHIPVIMISALDEMDSVVRCIEMGATDYLAKPFNPSLLKARIDASLVEKRLRDLELKYLEQVNYVAQAAQAVESSTYDPGSLDGVAAREDALGQLARVFQRMAREVHLREQRLKQQLRQLELDMDEMKKAVIEPPSVYLPMDRRQALADGQSLPDRVQGAALFADISGFTPFTSALAVELGLERGAEELTRLLNQVYTALIDLVHRWHGSVVNFSGDAITCWLDGDDGLGALACALEMQQAMGQFASVSTPKGSRFKISIKVAVVAGPARRFLTGNPNIQQVEVLAGRTLDELAAAEHCANPGEVLAQAVIVEQSAGRAEVGGWRTSDSGQKLAVVSALRNQPAACPWPELPAGRLPDSVCQPWLLPPVYERLVSQGRQFLSELRPAVALFLSFRGIEYDQDDQAGEKLSKFICWVQEIIQPGQGSLLQISMGDKGSYLYVAFGAPVAHRDDAARAVQAALALVTPPNELSFIRQVHIGLAQGQMRTGAYGSPTQRTYGVLGDKTNLAARLMQAAVRMEQPMLCDESLVRLARISLDFEALTPVQVKGKAEPVPVYMPTGAKRVATTSMYGPHELLQGRFDLLAPAEQLVLKVASVAGRQFEAAILRDIFPVEEEKAHLEERLQALQAKGLIEPVQVAGRPESAFYQYKNDLLHQIAYNSMLFMQRRQLHRQAAEWYERMFAGSLEPYFAVLASHWEAADEPVRAIDYLEKAAQAARARGDFSEAERLLLVSLELDARSAVLSDEYYHSPLTDEQTARQQ